jgi:hypothetical protein
MGGCTAAPEHAQRWRSSAAVLHPQQEVWRQQLDQPAQQQQLTQQALQGHELHNKQQQQLGRHAPFRRRLASRQQLLLLLALVGLSAPACVRAGDAFDSSRCQQWLRHYEHWHEAQRGRPSAKYLIAEAPGFVGVGDHLRGMMYALRVAAATQRVLLLHWEHPGNLTNFLVPASRIDWRFLGTPAASFGTRDLKQATTEMDVFGGADLGAAFPGARFFTHDPSNKTFLVLKTNFPAEQACIMCPGVRGTPAQGYDFVCLFRFLFRPSVLVQRMTDEYLRSLYHLNSSSSSSSSGSNSSSSDGQQQLASLEYAAVHLRLGQMRGEDATINRISGWVDPLAKFLLSVSCGRAVAQQAGVNVTATPMLLLADHRGIRHFSAAGRLAGVVAPQYEAVHTKLNSHRDHLLSFVDLNLLARAKCLVTSHSGFSNVGWWMSGGNSCRMMLGECHKACAKDPTGPFCA